MTGRWAIPLVALVFLAACSAEPPPPPPKPWPTTSATPLPRNPGLAVTSEQLARTEPCTLFDVPALSALGKVRVDPGAYYTY